MTDLLSDNGQRTSPAWSYFDPDEITGTSFRLDAAANGFPCWRTICAPNVALPGDADYVLIFKTGSQMPGIPGTTLDVDGWSTRNFRPGELFGDTPIFEVKKAGSTPGPWEVWP